MKVGHRGEELDEPDLGRELERAAEPDELSQTTALLKAEGMRALLVHRMREKVEGGTPFAPRRELRPMAARGSEVLDVCFVLDLTGSMG